MILNIDDTFNKALTADTNLDNRRRQVLDASFSFVLPRIPTDPKLIHVAEPVAELLGISKTDCYTPEFLSIFSGSTIYPNTKPFSMNYGGHQFGTWAGQLGDGRAINLFEVNQNNKRWAVQLKGAGETPYSRNADGLAVLRSSIREHLCSEAMHYLGVPTTRSLCLISSGDQVLRDVMYNGNPAYEPGAIVCRVAPTFIRFGNFEIFASRGDLKNLEALTNYTIQYFFPNIEIGTQKGYLEFYRTVVDSTFDMILQWQRVGFVHGVMNTDNMSIIGNTIDYGPYGWIDNFDPNWTPNTTDSSHKRYRFGNQPNIALWNLNQLANALFPLIKEVEPIMEILETARDNFPIQYLNMMRSKIGLFLPNLEDSKLLADLEKLLMETEMDMTMFFRQLSNFSRFEDQNKNFIDVLCNLSYNVELFDNQRKLWVEWLRKYQKRLHNEELDDEKRKQKMNVLNPKYVLRNYMAQLVIDEAEKGEYTLLNEIYELLKNPYDEQPEYQNWHSKRPDWAMNKIGCSMLSCSS